MDKKRTYIEAHVTGTTLSTKLYGALTSGMVGVPVAFSFDESWIELNKIAVFQGCTTKTRALVESNETTVPYEVLQSSGFELEIGVEGRTADGTIVYPSVMKWAGTIQEGADASADPGTEPSPTVYDDIMQAVGNLDSLKTKDKESLVAAINEIYERGGGGGTVDPAYVEQLVDEYLAENPPTVDKSEMVLNTPQNLTHEQKAQARENIGFVEEFTSLLPAHAIIHTGFQGLTDEERHQARANIGAVSQDDVFHTVQANAILYGESQQLTEEQQRTARENIGAASVEEVLAALPTWEGGSY